MRELPARNTHVRWSGEIDANLASVETTKVELEQRVGVARGGIEILQVCEDTPETVAEVNSAVDIARATNAMRLRVTTLNELTTNPRLLAQQSDEERQRFADMAVYFELLPSESRAAEQRPQEQRIEDLEALTPGAPVSLSDVYDGREFTKVGFPLVLKSSVAEACRSEPLTRTLFNWCRWQSSLPPFAEQARGELEATKAMLASRRS